MSSAKIVFWSIEIVGLLIGLDIIRQARKDDTDPWEVFLLLIFFICILGLGVVAAAHT